MEPKSSHSTHSQATPVQRAQRRATITSLSEQVKLGLMHPQGIIGPFGYYGSLLAHTQFIIDQNSPDLDCLLTALCS